MKCSDLIKYLSDALEEQGDMEVCVFSESLYAPSSGVVIQIMEDKGYYNVCEEMVIGDFMLLI